MTVFTIKIIALICMLIDHIGVIFFPDVLWLRMIGRMAFPLFAWLIANGAYHTSNKSRYILTLFLFAVLGQIPYVLAVRTVYPDFWNLNALFTLTLGLLAVISIEKLSNSFLRVGGVALCMLATMWLNVDYGVVGMLSVVFSYLYFHDFKKLALSQIMLFTFPFWLPALFQVVDHKVVTQDFVNLSEPLGCVSLFFIYRYNKKEGPKMKYLFYAFYPIHLIILFVIKSLA